MDVVLVRWPAEADRRERLRAAGTPRLLLVDEGPPPRPDDCREDWVRVPADADDVRARMDAVRRRVERHLGADLPTLDDDGVLRFGGSWVPLPPVEARLTASLVERFGAVVGREALTRAGWPDGAPGRNALDVHVLRLRRRLATVGLSIKTIRSRGYLLEGSARAQEQA